jgi:hypothetical protein
VVVGAAVPASAPVAAAPAVGARLLMHPRTQAQAWQHARLAAGGGGGKGLRGFEGGLLGSERAGCYRRGKVLVLVPAE